MLASSRMSRQGEIVEVVFRNGWDYMRRLLSGGKADEPDIPTPEVLRNILTELGPVYVKFGQLLSTRPDLLPARYIEALSSLQSTVQPVPASQMEPFIRQNLPGPVENFFQNIEYSAIAAGSIGRLAALHISYNEFREALEALQLAVDQAKRAAPFLKMVARSLSRSSALASKSSLSTIWR